MAIPARNSDRRAIIAGRRIFFVTSKTSLGRQLLQTQATAELLIDVLRSNTLAGKFTVREFVVMPDHLHALISLDSHMSVERAIQLIKGGYSFRYTNELGLTGEIWQPGYSEVRIMDRKSYLAHKRYIDNNPVKKGLAASAEEYPYCSAYLRKMKKASG
ncbi:MAG TPA: transposase [Candidatus Angelobacter sp.]|nr:transposase [Candidatus Angelobacter sp.]